MSNSPPTKENKNVLRADYLSTFGKYLEAGEGSDFGDGDG